MKDCGNGKSIIIESIEWNLLSKTWIIIGGYGTGFFPYIFANTVGKICFALQRHVDTIGLGNLGYEERLKKSLLKHNSLDE